MSGENLHLSAGDWQHSLLFVPTKSQMKELCISMRLSTVAEIYHDNKLNWKFCVVSENRSNSDNNKWNPFELCKFWICTKYLCEGPRMWENHISDDKVQNMIGEHALWPHWKFQAPKPSHEAANAQLCLCVKSMFVMSHPTNIS